MQERIESSATGRAVISAFVVVTLLGTLLTQMPASALGRFGDRVFGPYVEAVGLDQNWEVFAPDPRRLTLDVHAEVTFADGTTERWDVPTGGMVVDTYRFYRWQKWMESVRADANSQLWEPTARWIARTHERDGRDVTRVTLVRRWYDTPPPGTSGERPDFSSYEFYVLDAE